MDTSIDSRFSPSRLERIALAAAIVFALCGTRCATVFEKPELRFRGLRVNSISLGGAAVDVVVDVYNPNSFRLDVDHFSYDLSVENVHFGEGETDVPISVEGHGTADIRLPVHVNWSRLGDVGRGALQTGSVNYGISGELTIATGFGRRRIPYSKTGRFSVLQ